MNIPKADKSPNSFFPIKGLIAALLIRFLYLLPSPIVRSISLGISRLTFNLSAKKRNIILTNLRIAYPQLTDSQILDLARKSSRHSGLLLPEFLLVWFGNQQQVEEKIISVENRDIIEQLINKSQPIIVATPHIGNWEFLGQWIQINYPMMALYSPSKLPQMDKMILDSRRKFGGELYSADNKGILNLLRKLKKGGLMIILPDQVPTKGAGTYTPFFGQSAYTMTLLNKFVQKTQAQLIFAYCVRRKDERSSEIKIELPTFDCREKDVDIFNLGMNQQIEQIINRYPEQYVWDYKRYKCQQDDVNLYAMD